MTTDEFLTTVANMGTIAEVLAKAPFFVFMFVTLFLLWTARKAL